MSRSDWTVTRSDNEVRVDVVDSASLEEPDFLAIVDAVQDYLAEDAITTVRVDSPVLEAAPELDGLNTLIPRLVSLVDDRAVRLHVGPSSALPMPPTICMTAARSSSSDPRRM